jgi:hypothetical protein
MGPATKSNAICDNGFFIAKGMGAKIIPVCEYTPY